jgi:hypothetical protein
MQDVEIYIGETRNLSGTVGFVISDVIEDLSQNFNENRWVLNRVIVNTTTGVSGLVTRIYNDTSLQINQSGLFTVGDTYTIIQNPELADTFKDETISLTQSIKNIKDIAKVQTDFTKSFTLPASKVNNKIFKHYYRGDLFEGFDARFLMPAKIKLNGNDFKDGKIRLLGVKMTDNKPSSYKVNFTGSTVSLKTAFGDDELTDLPYLDAYNHIYSYTDIKTYMQDGYNPTGDGAGTLSYPELIYPFISTSKNRYYYDTSETTNSQPHITNVRNIFYDGTPPSNDHQDYRAIQYFDLKPAIKVYNILKAIEEKYGFTFSNDFFRTSVASSGKPNVDGLFTKLYMFCNRKAGSLVDVIDETSAEVKFEDLTRISGTDIRQNNDTSFELYTSSPSGGRTTYIRLRYQATINVTGTGAYDFELYDVDTEEVYQQSLNKTGSLTINVLLTASTNQTKIVKPSIRIKTKAGITSFYLGGVTLSSIEKPSLQSPETTTSGTYYSAAQTLNDGIDFRKKLLPKIKVIDFMTNLFKMFNLIAYLEGTELVVKTLDQYYLNSSHEEFNIDEYVDISSSEVNRSEIYNEINYEYKKANTIFAINSNEATNDEYGNERFKSEGENVFDGKKYDVKSTFGHMLFENLKDQSTDVFSGITFGHTVSQDNAPVIDGGSLFLMSRESLPSNIWVTDKIVGVDTSSPEELDNLYVPANVYTGFGVGVRSINFGSEFDEFTNSEEEDGLFKIYHQNFIVNIYNPQTRVLKITAHLPLKILLKYELNDRFVFQGRKYLINSIKTNLQTGKSELELLTDNYQEIE